jgi:hypothetical protein
LNESSSGINNTSFQRVLYDPLFLYQRKYKIRPLKIQNYTDLPIRSILFQLILPIRGMFYSEYSLKLSAWVLPLNPVNTSKKNQKLLFGLTSVIQFNDYYFILIKKIPRRKVLLVIKFIYLIYFF